MSSSIAKDHPQCEHTITILSLLGKERDAQANTRVLAMNAYHRQHVRSADGSTMKRIQSQNVQRWSPICLLLSSSPTTG